LWNFILETTMLINNGVPFDVLNIRKNVPSEQSAGYDFSTGDG
jgi:hypothetical protein